MNTATKNIFTIGHSTHSFDEFAVMLSSFHIEVVADIRRFPGSQRFPWFSKEVLQTQLMQKQMQYVHIPELGGRRKPHPDSQNIAWTHPAFRGYADYMETDEFKKGITILEKWALKQTTAILCAEALWWRCHRKLVSDYLKANGWTVWHIMGVGKSEAHRYSAPASIVNGVLSYSGRDAQS